MTRLIEVGLVVGLVGVLFLQNRISCGMYGFWGNVTEWGLTVFREFERVDRHCQSKICKFESKVLERIIIAGN